ncbi:MAG: hypothetical protein QXU98_05135 [Candidatus Parvarchaeota archaeon]
MGIMAQTFYVEDIYTTWGYRYIGKAFIIEGYITRDFSTISEKPYEVKVYKLSKDFEEEVLSSRSTSFKGAVRIMENCAKKLVKNSK